MEAAVATPGEWSLETTQIAVQQQEGIFGPLTALSATAGQPERNRVTFMIGPTPLHRCVLAAYTTAKPPVKPGFDVVASGSLWAEKKKLKVAAYRKT